MMTMMMVLQKINRRHRLETSCWVSSWNRAMLACGCIHLDGIADLLKNDGPRELHGQSERKEKSIETKILVAF